VRTLGCSGESGTALLDLNEGELKDFPVNSLINMGGEE
jgi:hypothetical protein